MKKSKYLSNLVIEQVPVDYYQKGVKENALQRVWHTRKLNAVLKAVSVSPSSILDAGCASGWFLSRMHKKFPKAKCTGIDIYKDAIFYGRKKYPKMKFLVSDAHKIPFKAQTFDLVICTEVLEHVEKPEWVIMEIKRVLKKNGQAVIELDSGSTLFSVVWFLWRLNKGGVWKDSHLHTFNIQKLERMLDKSGLTIENRKKFNLGMAMVFSVRKE